MSSNINGPNQLIEPVHYPACEACGDGFFMPCICRGDDKPWITNERMYAHE